jgi:hypothetical protein
MRSTFPFETHEEMVVGVTAQTVATASKLDFGQ